MAKLVVHHKGAPVGSWFLEDKRLTMGRVQGCDILLDDASISKQHAAIEPVGNDYFVQDLGSANGTFVNSMRVTRHMLRHGDVVRIRDYEIRYVDHKAAVGGENDRTMVFQSSDLAVITNVLPGTAVPAPGARTPDVKLPNAKLRGVGGSMSGRMIELTRALTPVGHPSATVAAVFRRPKGFYIAHVSGDTAPQLNGKAIGAGWHPLADRDVILAGGEMAEFRQES